MRRRGRPFFRGSMLRRLGVTDRLITSPIIWRSKGCRSVFQKRDTPPWELENFTITCREVSMCGDGMNFIYGSHRSARKVGHWTIGPRKRLFPILFPRVFSIKEKRSKGDCFWNGLDCPMTRKKRWRTLFGSIGRRSSWERSMISLSSWPVESMRRTSRTIVRRNTLISMSAIRSSCRRSRLMIWRIYRNG